MNQTVTTIVRTICATEMAAVFHVKMKTTLVLHVDRIAKAIYKDVIHVMD